MKWNYRSHTWLNMFIFPLLNQPSNTFNQGLYVSLQQNTIKIKPNEQYKIIKQNNHKIGIEKNKIEIWNKKQQDKKVIKLDQCTFLVGGKDSVFFLQLKEQTLTTYPQAP